MRSIMDLKQKNLLDILTVIQIHGPISKPDIAIMANVSTVTAHNFISELEKAGIVVSSGVKKSNGGRKAVLYKTNPDYGCIIGVNHGRSMITTSIYDLSLNAMYVNRIEADLTKSGDSIENIKMEITEAISKSGVSKDKVLGVGITLPGQIDHGGGVVNSMFDLTNWDNTPLQSIMEKSLGLPICVYNDNRANVISCKWLNKIRESANAVYISVGDGVGAGVMINGEVFSGSHSFAGELGHLSVRGNKTKCQCGKVGCVETIACNANIIRQVAKKLDFSSMKDRPANACVNEIIQMAKGKNNDVYEIIKEAVQNIIYIVDSVIKVYDPDKIIIYNPWLLHFDELFNELIETVFAQCKWLKKNTLSIELDASEVIDSYGPASIVLENLFNYNAENRIILRMDAI